MKQYAAPLRLPKDFVASAHDLSRHSVLLTGAEQPLGRDMAQALAQCGAQVLALGHIPDAAKFASPRLRWLNPAELTQDPDGWNDALSQCLGADRVLDLILAHRYLPALCPAELVREEDWNQSLRLTLAYSRTLLLALIPLMREQPRNHIIRLGCDAAHFPRAYFSCLSPCQAAIDALIYTIADELEHNTRAFSLDPGALDAGYRQAYYPGKIPRKISGKVAPPEPSESLSNYVIYLLLHAHAYRSFFLRCLQS